MITDLKKPTCGAKNDVTSIEEIFERSKAKFKNTRIGMKMTIIKPKVYGFITITSNNNKIIENDKDALPNSRVFEQQSIIVLVKKVFGKVDYIEGKK